MRGRPRRIGVVITRLSGGAGALALRGAWLLDPNEFDVTIITGPDSELLAEAERANLKTLVVPALCRPIAPHRDVTALQRLRSVFTRKGFDVVHTHCAKAGTLGRLAARAAGIPRIVHTYHGFPFHEFQNALHRRAYVEFERGLGRITHTALCVGTGVSVEALRRGLLPPERVRTLDIAVDLSATRRTPETRLHARRQLGLDSAPLVVGAVARVVYQKAPEDFVRALEMLDGDVLGVWIGGGAAPSSVESKVRFVGHRWDVTGLLPALDVFCLPSRYEGVPLAIAEAMVCGVPVVATAVNGVSDLVIPGRTGLLVPPRRPDLLADAVRHVLRCPEQAARMVSLARERVHACCRDESLADTLALAYSEESG